MSEILLFGSKGQLGFEIKQNLKSNYKISCLHRSSKKHNGNFLDYKSLIKSIRDIKPKIITAAIGILIFITLHPLCYNI